VVLVLSCAVRRRQLQGNVESWEVAEEWPLHQAFPRITCAGGIFRDETIGDWQKCFHLLPNGLAIACTQQCEPGLPTG